MEIYGPVQNSRRLPWEDAWVQMGTRRIMGFGDRQIKCGRKIFVPGILCTIVGDSGLKERLPCLV